MTNNNGRGYDWVLIGILSGVVLGFAFGLLLGETMLYIKFIGDLFMKSLRVIVIPLIMAAMISSMTGLGDLRKLGPMGFSTLGYYLITTCLSVSVGLLAMNLFRPGQGIDYARAEIAPDFVEGAVVSITDIVTGLIPGNIFDSMAKTDVLPVIICSLFFGGVLTTLGKEGETVVRFFEGLNAAMMKIVHVIMLFAPIGIFALVGSIIGEKSGNPDELAELFNLIYFILTVVLGLSIHAFLTMPLILFFIGKRQPHLFAGGMLSALATAFSTSSSAATLPVTMECAEKNNKVPHRITSFVLPIGATVNMDGTALYMGASVLFISQAYGLELTMAQQMLVFLTVVLGSIGTAAIPHASLVLLVPILQAVNLPLEGITLIFAVDWFLDRCRTTVNIWGDSVGCAVVQRLTENTTAGESPSGISD